MHKQIVEIADQRSAVLRRACDVLKRLVSDRVRWCVRLSRAPPGPSKAVVAASVSPDRQNNEKVAGIGAVSTGAQSKPGHGCIGTASSDGQSPTPMKCRARAVDTRGERGLPLESGGLVAEQ